MGFCNEGCPRYLLNSIRTLAQEEPDDDDIELLLRRVFSASLLCAPLDHRVVLCESIVAPRARRESIVRVLLHKMKCAAVLLVQAPLACVVPSLGQNVPSLGLTVPSSESDWDGTGIVVLVGYSETSVLPVHGLVPLMHCLEHAQLGTKNVHDSLASGGEGGVQWTERSGRNGDDQADAIFHAGVQTGGRSSGAGEKSFDVFARLEELDDVIAKACFISPSREVRYGHNHVTRSCHTCFFLSTSYHS